MAAVPAVADQVRASTAKTDRPAIDKSLFAVVVSPDRAHTFADIQPDQMRAINSWRELPAILQALKTRSQATGQVVVLDLAVHGNNGTGLKVVHGSAKGDVASVTSMAEVNRMVRSAGFAPGEIVILTEGCNVHRSWTNSADGFTAAEKAGVLHQAERLATGHGQKLASTPEIVDSGPTQVDKDYQWLGRGPGTNWISTVFLQYVTGAEEGAPLEDLRRYKDPKAPLAAQTDAVMLVAGMRPQMIAAIQETRFGVSATATPGAATGARRFVDRMSIRSTPATQQTADDSEGTSPEPTRVPGATAPVQPATTDSLPATKPVKKPADSIQTGLRFIDRLRRTPVATYQP